MLPISWLNTPSALHGAAGRVVYLAALVGLVGDAVRADEGSLVRRMDEFGRRLAIAVYDYFILAARTAAFAVTRPFYWRDLVIQLDRLGAGSFPILLLTGVFSGMVLGLQAATELADYGMQSYLGVVVGKTMILELGPVLTALGVAGRSGCAITAEIASMRVTEQIDAMQVFGTDPIRKLVVPRVLAIAVMMPALTVLVDFLGLIGGLLIGAGGVPASAYFLQIMTSFAQSGLVLRYVPKDFVAGLVKPLVFGFVVPVTSSFFGLRASRGTESVGFATAGSVVASSMLIFALDYFITQTLAVLLYAPA